MRLEDSLSDTHPLIQKKKKKKHKTFKKTSSLSPKQKNKNANPKTQTIFPDQNSDSLRLAILRCTFKHTDWTSVFQPIKQTNKKKNLCNSENLCSFSAIVKTENLCSSFATTDNSEGRHFSPFFGFLFNYCF